MTKDAQEPTGRDFYLLPFRFNRLSADPSRVVLTNLVGQYQILRFDELVALFSDQLSVESALFRALESKHFLYRGSPNSALELLAAKYRTRQRHLPELAALHIFVLTLRCTNSCSYCQVSQRTPDATAYDMSIETASLAIDFMFGTPGNYLKVEFQGGEPLFRFDLVRYIVDTVKGRAEQQRRRVEFVLCTNLALLSPTILAYCRDHDILISTSLDGPPEIHDLNRSSPTGFCQEQVVGRIRSCQEELGFDRLAALMTTTRRSLPRPREIIDEYIRCRLRSIFLRPINPYGRSAESDPELIYSTDEWLDFYKTAVRYIIDLNRAGVSFREDFASILLRRVLTHSDHGFVDLQSPTGAFSAVVAYNFDGGIFPSDEARMLAAMGDSTFRFGELGAPTYGELITSDRVLDFLSSTMTEGMPDCCLCAFQPYCGSDPIRHYRIQGDVVGHKRLSEFCQKQKGVLEFLLLLLEESDENWLILRRWVGV